MKKTVKNFLIILLVILISIFIGYEHPSLVEVPKKYVYFFLKKIGLRDNFLNKKVNKDDLQNFDQDKFLEFKGNSFSVMLSKVKSFKGKSASVIIKKSEDELDYEIYTQDGFLLRKNEISEINLPLSYHNNPKHSSGVKTFLK